MKGSQKVIDALNSILTHELTSMDVYFLHSRIYEDLGLMKLYERINHEMTDETGHASLLVERILLLEGNPGFAKRHPFKSSRDVRQMLQDELDYEIEVADELKEAIVLCESEKDFASREVLLQLLKDTETDHILWLQTQVSLIDRIGLQNYCQAMM